ncbi:MULTISPECIES: hypothetical protein [Nocardioides]|uniref:Uncharacterized protein n=1 Tax=Nocardioides vastitatis TaxID=2568655 RepID=A0ABW0ZEU8_9ACTN|nr:hypothetical protein [Nocardioides sp.]THI95732.1 hypothetical protein E7Z54_18325 [Nocardioides sp.]
MKSYRQLPTWILRGLVILGLLLCLPPAAIGGVVLLGDALDGSEGEYDGLGMALGGIILVAALVGMLVLGLLLLMLFRWPRVGLATTGVLAGLALLGAIALLVNDPDTLLDFLVYAGGATTVIALAIWGLAPRLETPATTPAAESFGPPHAP